MTSKYLEVLLTLSLIIFAPLTFAENGVTANQIVIGQSAAFTGPAGELGKNVRAGAEAYFDQINKQGGIYGRKIVLKSYDDGYESARAAENTKLLIEKDKVFALFGYVGTPTSLAAKPLFDAENIPFIGAVTGAEKLRVPFNKNIFNIRASYFDETREIVKFLGQTRARSIAVVYQNDSYGQAGLEGVIKAMAEYNEKPIITATVERNSTDVSKAVATVSKANPGAVIIISAYKSSAEFSRQIDKTNPGIQKWNVSFVGTTELAAELGNAGRGVGISQVVPFPYFDFLPVTRDHRLALGKEISFTSLEGYIAAKVFVEALRRAGRNLNRESLTTAFENAGEIDVGGFSVSFSPHNHNGSTFVSTTMISRNGKVIQ